MSETVDSRLADTLLPKENASITTPIVPNYPSSQQLEKYSTLAPADLGSIITNNNVRKVVWAIYGIIGIFIVGIMGGLTAAQWIAPEWFIFTTGAYTAISPAFASLAMANIHTTKKEK